MTSATDHPGSNSADGDGTGDLTGTLCSPPLYQAEVRVGATHVLLCVAGELDLATARCLEPDLQQAHTAASTAGQPLVIHLDRVRFCDLRGLYALHTAARTAASGGHHITFVAAATNGDHSSVRWLLELLASAATICLKSLIDATGNAATVADPVGVPAPRS